MNPSPTSLECDCIKSMGLRRLKESERSNVFFSPTFVIRYFLRKCGDYGYSNVLRRYKKLDEARVASLYLLAISKGNMPLWLQAISDKEQFPDLVGFSPKRDKGGTFPGV